jgi:hypothetical protein
MQEKIKKQRRPYTKNAKNSKKQKKFRKNKGGVNVEPVKK